MLHNANAAPVLGFRANHIPHCFIGRTLDASNWLVKQQATSVVHECPGNTHQFLLTVRKLCRQMVSGTDKPNFLELLIRPLHNPTALALERSRIESRPPNGFASVMSRRND